MRQILLHTHLRTALVILSGIIACCLLWRIRPLLPPLLVTIAIAYLITPFVDILEKRRFNRMLAILTVYAVLLGAFVFSVLVIVPSLSKEVSRLFNDLPDMNHWLHEKAHMYNVGNMLDGLPSGMRGFFTDGLKQLQSDAVHLLRNLINMTISSLSLLSSLLIAPILAYYLLRDLPSARERLLEQIPTGLREEIRSLINEINTVMGSVVRGQILVASSVGLLATLGFVLLQMPFALLLGVIVGVTDLIPYFGPFIGGVPALIIAFFISPWVALKTIGVIIAVHEIEGTFITPKVMGDRVGVHPLVVLLGLMVGGELLGVVGMLLATPILALVRIVGKYAWYKIGWFSDVNGDEQQNSS